MTLGELLREIKQLEYREKNRQQAQAIFDYSLAQSIANFVAISMGSKQKPPTLYETYPSLFEKELMEEKVAEEQDKRSVAVFLQFASAFNKKFSVEDKDVK